MPSPPSPVGLYVHVPFRRAPRPYDDAAYAMVSPAARHRYLSALETEAEVFAAPRLADRSVTSVHVGGGRPSLLPLSDLQRILAILPVDSVSELTVEVSPADASAEYMDGLADLGATRVCVEGLSFSTAALHSLDAPAPVDAVEATIERAKLTEIHSLALDLVFGMEGLSTQTWTETLRRAVALDLPHLSIAEAPSPASANEGADQMERALSLLTDAGYEHYSLTHFAQPGHRSAHQVHYDRHGSVLGLGPSAASLWWTQPSPPRAERWSNVEDLDAYVRRLRQNKLPATNQETLSAHALGRDYILLRLRTRDGLDLGVLRNSYGVRLSAAAEALVDRLRAEGLAVDAPNRVRLTPRGRLLTDAITRRLLSSL
ncbi:MAG: coproporphyrinogen-III oxidase family protein [Salinivenus sp.]